MWKGAPRSHFLRKENRWKLRICELPQAPHAWLPILGKPLRDRNHCEGKELSGCSVQCPAAVAGVEMPFGPGCPLGAPFRDNRVFEG